jgi:hypothetical protein
MTYADVTALVLTVTRRKLNLYVWPPTDTDSKVIERSILFV